MILLNHTSPKSHHQNQNIKRDRKRNPSFASTERRKGKMSGERVVVMVRTVAKSIVRRRLCVIRVSGVEWSALACKLRQGLSQEGSQEDGGSFDSDDEH